MIQLLDTFRLQAAGDRQIVITREFAASRRTLFGGLTRPELVRRWLLGPPGWSMVECQIDLQVGGAYRYVWRHVDGRELGMGGEYRDIALPAPLVHTERFDMPWYVGNALVTTELAEHNGRTSLTGTVEYESAAARDSVLASGMEAGAVASYDRLEALLSIWPECC